MCGIAGVIHRDGSSDIGSEMTSMLQSMKHRGPDSTGYALFGHAHRPHRDPVQARRRQRPSRLRVQGAPGTAPDGGRDRGCRKIGASIDRVEGETEYAYRATVRYDGDLKALADYLEDVPGCEVLSLGHSLEIVKDLGDAQEVSSLYGLAGFEGTHAIGHVRMATESDVDISGAHPYWAYPFSDVAVVHNGQLTNYFQWKRRLEASGHRFQSECDSEIIAVYLAEKMAEGPDLKDGDEREPGGPRRRVHVHGGHAGQPRRGQGRDGGEAARPVRVRRPGRDGLGGDRDPRADRSRDRHVRPVRRAGAGMEHGSGVAAGAGSRTTPAAWPNPTPRSPTSPRSTAPTAVFDAAKLTTRQINLELR